MNELTSTVVGFLSLHQKTRHNFSAVKNPYNYFTAEFENSYKQKFAIDQLGIEHFFTDADRIRVVRYLLDNTKFQPHVPEQRNEAGEVIQKKQEGLAGVDRMVSNGSLTGAFPLHDGDYEFSHPKGEEKRHWINFIDQMNPRQKLYYTWASPKMWYKAQPMDPIRRYFGEKIAMYFSWLGYYTIMLAFAALLGIIIFLYGLITMGNNAMAKDACEGGKNADMIICPVCDKPCTFELFSTECSNIRVSQVFDNEATVVYAIFMAFWATMFLEFWKRKQNELQFEWDLFDFEENQETLRPEYEEKAQKNENSWMKQNPITKDLEPLMPSSYKIPRLFMSISTVLFMICVVLAAIVGVIIYRVIVSGLLYRSSNSFASGQAGTVTSMTAAVLNLVAIMLFSRVYERLATKLTDLECPRTETEYEDSYTMKMFVFQFVNYYSSIVYLGFFKGKFAGYPGKYNEILGNRQEQCKPSGCLLDLTMQLLIVMVGKQFINNVMEIGVPLIMEFVKKKKMAREEQERVRRETEKRAASSAEPGYGAVIVEANVVDTLWEKDSLLSPQPKMNLFGEYLEMVIQFGFTTLFATAFPLAPFFAFINNVIEIRLDAFKFVCQLQRPWAQKAQDIGSWYDILYMVGVAAVLFNAFSLVLTSSFVDKAVYNSKSEVGETFWDFVYTTANATEIFPNFECSQAILDHQNVTVEECLLETCYYKAYRHGVDSDEVGNPTKEYYHVLAAKLMFVIAFEHLVFITKFLVAFLVPDMPGHVKVAQLREQHLTRMFLYEKSD